MAEPLGGGVRRAAISGETRVAKIFISHAHDDTERCKPLLAALDALGVDYWFDQQRVDAGHNLSDSIQKAIEERDIFLRTCTPAAQQSRLVKLETGVCVAEDNDLGRNKGGAWETAAGGDANVSRARSQES
jgi:TIR domain